MPNKKPNKSLLTFKLFWGYYDSSTEKYSKHHEMEIEAISFTRAKVLATQILKAWAKPQKNDDEQMATNRRKMNTAIYMGINQDRWSTEVKSKENGNAFILKTLGGFWSKSQYVALELQSDIA